LARETEVLRENLPQCHKVGQVPIEDVKRSGQPSTSKMAENVEKI
jgi:hypothetical protein